MGWGRIANATLWVILALLAIDVFSALVASAYSVGDPQQHYETYREAAEERGGIITWFLLEGKSEAFTAVGTFAIAVFTIVLAQATIRLGTDARDAAVRQDRRAHELFVATHRPRLRVRRIHQIQIVANSRPSANIDVANIGATGARVVGFGIDIFPRPRNHQATQFNAVPTQTGIGLPPIEPGQQLTLAVIGGQILTAPAIARINAQTDELCLLGIVQYMDANNTLRLTSYFRVYDTIRQRFVQAPKDDEFSDWEYED